jgi:hypothetical protein
MEFNLTEIVSERWYKKLLESIYDSWREGESIADIANRVKVQEYVIECILREVVNGNE